MSAGDIFLCLGSFSDVRICIYWNIKRDVSLCFASYNRSEQGSALTLALFAIELSPNKAVTFEFEKLIKLMDVELRWCLQNETAREIFSGKHFLERE